MDAAFGWGLLSASSLVIGSLVAIWLHIGLRVIGLIIAFGAGVLISAVASELVEEAAEKSSGVGAVAWGLFIGCAVFFGGDWLISSLGGGDRKDATGDPGLTPHPSVRLPTTQGGDMKPAIAVTALVLALSLTACGDDEPDEPDAPAEAAVCTSVDDLRSSVDDVQAIEVESGTALADLQSGLAAVESAFSEVKADAKSEFAAPVDAVQSSLVALKTSVEAATTTESAETLAAVGPALSTFGTDVQALVDDVESTC